MCYNVFKRGSLMRLLEHKLTNDILFKMMFVKYPELLKKLVAVLLCIPLDSITEFEIVNPEIPPEALGEKFCRLDINMVVNGQRVDLEIQLLSKKSDKTCYPDSLVIRAGFVRAVIAAA
jgi:hypothetical protein